MAGAQRVMADILLRLDPDRYQRFAVCNARGPLTELLTAAGVECRIVSELQRSINPWRDVRAYRALRTLFSELECDVVHTHSSKPGALGRPAARRAGVPAIVHHVHGFSFHERTPAPLRLIGEQIERAAAACCERVVFLNEAERDYAVQAGIVSANQACLIYNGVDLQAFRPVSQSGTTADSLRERLGAKRDEAVVVFAGRIAPQKQPLIVPRIALHLERLVPQRPWRIVLAGSGPLLPALRREINRLNVNSRVQTIDWHSDSAELMQAADVVLHPTLWEGLPLTLIEALATSVPVVASDIRGNRDVVGRDSGVLCPPSDERAYACELARLIIRPDLRRTFGTAGRLRAERCFNADVNYARVAQLYETLLDDASKTPVRRAA